MHTGQQQANDVKKEARWVCRAAAACSARLTVPLTWLVLWVWSADSTVLRPAIKQPRAHEAVHTARHQRQLPNQCTRSCRNHRHEDRESVRAADSSRPSPTKVGQQGAEAAVVVGGGGEQDVGGRQVAVHHAAVGVVQVLQACRYLQGGQQDVALQRGGTCQTAGSWQTGRLSSG